MNSSGPAAGIRDDRAYPKLKEHLIYATGLAYYAGRDDALAPIVEHRLAALNLSECGQYLDLLRGETGEEELHAIAARLTIGETYFFRNPEHFDALRSVILPEILGRKAAGGFIYGAPGAPTARNPIPSRSCCGANSRGRRPVGISVSWGPTSTTYSWSRRERADSRSGPSALSSRFSRQAVSIKTAPSAPIDPAYREGISFEYHNLIESRLPAPWLSIGGCDLIFCRNVLIYFGQRSVLRVVSRFHSCLSPKGWLVVGPAETGIGAFEALFTAHRAASVLYQKRGDEDRVKSSETHTVRPSGSMSVRMESTGPACVSNSEDTKAEPALARVCLLADRGEWEQALRYCEQAVLEDDLNPLVHF